MEKDHVLPVLVVFYVIGESLNLGLSFFFFLRMDGGGGCRG